VKALKAQCPKFWKSLPSQTFSAIEIDFAQ
jgi:hypothetical protein